jgi:hypothetical protein
MLNVVQLRRSFGQTTDEEILEGFRSIGAFAEPPKDIQVARQLIRDITQALLDQGRYLEAGVFLWGERLFNPFPASTRRVFRALSAHSQVILLGAASVSKSYSAVVYLLLDWLRDPQYTGEKFISTTAGHAKANVFSTLHRLYSQAIIPLPGMEQDGFLGLDPKDHHSAITKVAIPPGEDGKAAMQGFHPLPRPKPHPDFGDSSRMRACLDEAEDVPQGVWPGIANALASKKGKEIVKIICATNPKDVTSELARQAEPVFGWTRLDPDVHHEWTSRTGWHVVRLDGALSENVVQQREVYPNLLTWEGFENFRREGGGEGGSSVSYWTFARGVYPLAGQADNLIPLSYLDSSRADLVFESPVVGVAGVDLAFEGDEVILAYGRYGRCLGYRKPDDERMTPFEKPRWCVQLDQLYPLLRQRTRQQFEQINFYCSRLGVDPEWLVIDRTGNGTGVFDLASDYWKGRVRGTHWGSGPTKMKILDEDKDTPEEICRSIDTEMHLALRRWCEFGHFWISPRIDTAKLFNDLSGRKVRPLGKGKTNKTLMALEPKREFKKRNKRSPDHGDACVMMLHAARLNGKDKASLHGTAREPLHPSETLDESDVFEQHSFALDDH